MGTEPGNKLDVCECVENIHRNRIVLLNGNLELSRMKICLISIMRTSALAGPCYLATFDLTNSLLLSLQLSHASGHRLGVDSGSIDSNERAPAQALPAHRPGHQLALALKVHGHFIDSYCGA